jgi:hypothetical protein
MLRAIKRDSLIGQSLFIDYSEPATTTPAFVESEIDYAIRAILKLYPPFSTHHSLDSLGTYSRRERTSDASRIRDIP